MLARIRALFSLIVLAALFAPETACAVPAARIAPAPTSAAATVAASSTVGTFAASRRRSNVPLAISYDTSVGNGVDVNGFASLPLYAGGTTGADVLTGAPTVASGITYTSATRSITGTAPGGTELLTWANVLTPGQTYRLQLGYNKASYAQIHIHDENGNSQWDSHPMRGYSGSGTLPSFYDETFVATGHDFILYVNNDLFPAGASVSIGIVAPQTGPIPAHRFYVRAAGDDTENPIAALNPATPLASIAQAMQLVIPGSGDQILVAQGDSFPGGIPLLDYESGRSPVYPLVVQSYDPSDPTNEAKLGHATGANRPRIGTAGWSNTITNNGASGVSYLAFRGLKWDAPDVPGQDLTFLAGTDSTVSYVLFENDILSNTSLSADLSQNAGYGLHWVIRNTSQFGSWGAGGHYEPYYFSRVNGLTIEDSILFHGGWRVGTSRDADISVGGLVGDQVFRHAVYAQNSTIGMVFRRNLSADGAADCGHLLGDTIATENLLIDCPQALDMTGGVGYDTVRPNGVLYVAAYNGIVGAEDLTSTDPRGVGIVLRNSAPGSAVHHNVLIRVNNASAGNRTPFSISADFGKPSYTAFHDNVSYLRAVPGNSYARYPIPTSGSLVYASALNNKWDDPADSAGNIDVSGVTFPNAYTDTSLYAAGGYANKQALIDYAIANPETHPQRALLNLLLAGYGINHTVGASTSDPADTTAPILTSPTLVANDPTTATIGATSDEAGGMRFWVLTASATTPNRAQVKAGQDATGAAAAASGSVEGRLPGTFTVTASGLSAGATLYAHLMQEDPAANQSAVVSTGAVTLPTSGTGPELVSNGSFTDTSAWSLSSTASITGGQLVLTNAQSWAAWQGATGKITSGHTYRITFTIVSRTAGTACVYVGSTGTQIGCQSAPGTYTGDFVADSSNELGFFFSAFSGAVDDLSIKEVF